MNCRDFQEMIDSYLSDELLTETNHDVLRHLEDCADCRKVIEARREVRSHLKSAVINAPQYQIGKNFTHNLQTQLKFEAQKMQEAQVTSSFGFGSWIAAAAGLLVVFTLGFFLLGNNSVNNEKSSVAKEIYTTTQVPANDLINIAFGDHQFCAVGHDHNAPVKFVATPAKYENIEETAMPELKNVLANCSLKEVHTCEYRGTKFAHLIVTKDNKILSVMLTDKDQAEKLGESIDFYSSSKYQMARFDINETAVFVVSEFNKQLNSQVADALYSPIQKHLGSQNTFQTALLTRR